MCLLKIENAYFGTAFYSCRKFPAEHPRMINTIKLNTSGVNWDASWKCFHDVMIGKNNIYFDPNVRPLPHPPLLSQETASALTNCVSIDELL